MLNYMLNIHVSPVNCVNMYIEHVVQHKGLSAVVISDRGRQFQQW